ncbi:MAG: hypothetical protein AAF487_15110 [Bacteroidota bacterium]
MSELKAYEGKSTGGILAVYLQLVENVIQIPSASGINLSNDINPSSFQKINPLDSTARFKETSKVIHGSQSYNYEIPFSIRKDRSVVTQLLSNLMNRKLIAITEDFEGLRRVIGSLDEPARLNWTFNKGESISSPNRYDVVITCQQTNPAYYYSGNLSS